MSHWLNSHSLLLSLNLKNRKDILSVCIHSVHACYGLLAVLKSTADYEAFSFIYFLFVLHNIIFTIILISDLPHRLSPDLQSPGHDSVSSSVTVGSGASSGCRNSTTSTDSGRGSSEGGGASLSHTAGVKPGGRPGPGYGHQHRSVSSLHVSITQCHPRLSNVSSSQSSVCSSLGSSRQSHHSSSSSIQDR